MNAKKLIMLGASAMLLASCGQSLTRADAIEAMDAISKKTDVSAKKLTYVKEWKEDNTGTKIKGKLTKVYDAEADATHVVKDYVNDGTTVKGEAWLITDKGEYTVALDNGESKRYVKSTSDALQAAVKGVAAGAIASNIAAGLKHGSKNNGYGYCGFLAKFPEGKTGYAAGGSIAEGAYITDESYKKTGEGSIACTYNAVYPNQGDEIMKAEWKDYFLIAKSNAKLTSSGYGFETWKYGTGSVSAPKVDSFTVVDGTIAITAFLAEVALFIA